MNKEKIYQMAISKWGKELQIIMGIEEMAELTKELVKSLRGKDNRENIIEEIADVEIMIGQLKRLFVVGNDLTTIRRKKMLRLEKMLQPDLLTTEQKSS